MSVKSPNKTAHLWVFYCRNKKKGKQKRLPWQEAVFNVVDNLGRLSPTGRRFGPIYHQSIFMLICLQKKAYLT